jgi:hypothetical protein
LQLQGVRLHFGVYFPCFMQLGGQDDSLPVRNAPQALGFRCTHCTSEFATRRAMDCQRRTQSSLGTGCAGSSHSKSVSFTAWISSRLTGRRGSVSKKGV